MESRRSGFAALATAGSLDELRTRQEAFARLPSVAEVVSVLKLIPAEQDAKIATIRQLAPLLAGIRIGGRVDEDPARLVAALQSLRRRLGIALREAEGRPVGTALVSAQAHTERLLALAQAAKPDTRARLAAVEASLRDDFGAKLRRLQDNLDPRPVTIAELPVELRRKFVGASGRLLMQIYPAIDTWDREGAREFVTALRTVDPAVTGSPVIGYEATRLMEGAYLQGTLYAVILVGVLAVVMLRRPLDALASVTPVVLGTLWTIGFMRLVGLSFNLANVWGLPLIIGGAAEYGLNVTLRYREASTGGRFPRSTILAVVLNGLTTIAGFGSLMIARHQGIFGLGLLLTVGATASLAASLVVLPVLLRLLDAGHTRQPHLVTSPES
jgi:predicted RND superfamily exporter protein